MEFYFLLTVKVTDATGLGGSSLQEETEENRNWKTKSEHSSVKAKAQSYTQVSVFTSMLGITTTSGVEGEGK